MRMSWQGEKKRKIRNGQPEPCHQLVSRKGRRLKGRFGWSEEDKQLMGERNSKRE